MSDKSKNLPEQLVSTLRKWSTTIELVYNTAQMRHYQKAFFKERENAKLKGEHLEQAKSYEKEVDRLLDLLWPVNGVEQKKLFE